MSIGVCYFPEHWPEERWATDVEQMAEAGIEYVRMGEFAWSRFEPEPGEFRFEWLETVLDLLDERGIEAVLCTPTATPPKWLVDRRPSILQEEADGTTRAFGSRRHYCFNSEAYREETERVVSALAERFANNPAVAGWQTDNEYGCHGTVRCYCEDCAAAFREWLRERYGDVETLNETWGTAFWSQDHTAFEEVEPPRHTAAEHHPARLLDYHRFCSDSVVEYNRLQARLLRDANDDWFVTHNFMNQFSPLDPFDVGEDLDFAAWDSYPTGFPQVTDREATADELRIGNPDAIGLDHDLYRCAADGQFWVMEQQPGDINWPPAGTQPAEGAMRTWAHHAVAHGAAVVSYFRWRRCRQGQEQYHAGLRERDGSADRGYRDAAAAAEDFAALDVEEPVDAPVAVVLDYDSLWALDEQPMAPDFDFWAHLETYYRALRARGVHADVVPPEASFDGYDAVVAPTLHVASDGVADSLEAVARDGGAVLVTMRSGEKSPGNQLRDAMPPGPFADLVGASVTEHETVVADDPTLTYDGEAYGYRTWREWLDVADAEGVGSYADDGPALGQFEDGVAIARREADAGVATYVGTWPSADLADALVGDLLDDAGVAHAPEPLPEGVRVARRDGVTWFFNWTSDPATVEWDGDRSTVSPFDFEVVEEPVDLASVVAER